MKEKLYDLTAPQKSILYTEQYFNGTNINNVCGTAIIEEKIDFELLKKAVNLVAKHNSSFNIKLCLENNEVKQYIADYEPFDIEVVDVKTKDDVRNIENDLMKNIFDIYSNLFTFKLFRFPNGSGGFLLNVHHLISDSWTLGLTAREIVRTYSSLAKKEEPDFSSFYSYTDYIESENEYKNSDKFLKDKEYWNSIFETVPETATIPSMQSITDNFSCKANRITYNVDMNKINEFCKDFKISPFNFFMAIYAIYTGRVSNLDEFVIGTPILNRTNFKEKNTTGMFINTVPFKINIKDNPSFKSFVDEIAKDSLGMLRHQKYSYQYILEDLRKINPNLPNLYNIMLSYQITKANTENGLSYETDWAFNGSCGDDLDIHLFDINDTGSINIAYDYRTDKYTEEEISNLHKRILCMIDQVIGNKEIMLNEIEIVTPEEKNEILYKFNDTDADYPKDKTIVDLFEEQVRKTPDKIAVTCNNQNLTYAELNMRSNQLARYLISSNVKFGDIIGIMVNRSLEMVIGLLGILKSGAAYLPIDPDYPSERISYMLENSQTRKVLVNSNTTNILPKGYEKIDISFSEDFFKFYENKNLNLDFSPLNLMYLIYTSGSTGNPKGVMLTHKNIHNFIIGITKQINFSADKVMVSLTTICFDIFVLELWCSLTHGLQVVIANEEEQKDIVKFNKLCINNKVSMIQTTPSRLSAFLDDSEQLDYLFNLTDIMVGGESLPDLLLQKLKKLSHAKIYNMYGPTETAVWSTMKDLSNTNNISIGKPISNTICYILDKNKNLLPPYIPGELYIGGDGVSNGYLNREELTKEKFIDSPFDSNKLIYNTGDLAYFTNDGEIIHLGRTDFQVKIRGYRVELGEIENIISSFDTIKNCVVMCHYINNKQILCAYYTSISEIDTSSLKNYILQKLPTYMIPSHFIHLDNFPQTPNGKIDRKALAFYCKDDTQEFILPKDDIEKKLFNIIASIIHTSNFSMTDNLFSIGMDSIGIIKLSSQIEQTLGIYVTIKDLYNVNSIQELSDFIKNSNPNISIHIPKATKQDFYPLSYSQKEMFLASMIDENSIVYNVSCGLLIDSILDSDKIQSSFKKIIDLQPSLRTSFKTINGIAYQVVLDNVDFNIEIYEDKQINQQLIIDSFPKPFNLHTAPLIRVAVYYLDNKKTLILIDSHHIIMDGTSLAILLKDFCKFYKNEAVSNLDINYIDYTMWENNFINSDEFKTIESYWINKLNNSDLPILNLPYDFAISNMKSFNGNNISINLDANVFKSVEKIAQKYKISPYTFYICVLYILLYKYTGQNDIIITSPMDLRLFSTLENIIGMFVNNIVLRNIVDTSKTFADFLCSTHSFIKDSLSNQPYPYHKLVENLNSKSTSLLDVVFTYQTPHKESFEINNSNFELLRSNNNTAKFKLLLEIIPDMNTIRLEYNSNLFKYETAKSFIEHYLFILKTLLKNQNEIISNIPIITENELQLLYDFNNTVGEINDDTFVSIFEKQVSDNPDNIALICNDETLTYNELNQKANSLAHYLIKNGIKPNDIVCIMTNRSLETIVCMLGISKAGAAFFNVDPTYPVERTKYYIENSQTKYVLTQKELKDKVKEIENCIEIDLSNNDIYGQHYENPNVKVNPNDLSYIIYTSGSTGTPKGVMLNQVGLANMVKAMTKVLDYLKEGNRHTIASVTSTPFDIFVYEIVVSLAHGLRVVMANNAEHRNPKLLDALIRKYNVDVMTVTPSLMKINYDNREPDSALALVKNMVFGGEPLPEKFVKDLKALADDITIYNIYGPSEITVLSNVQNLDGEKEITVGPPIMNTQIHILDKNMKRVPIGVVGEIYISGIQVGLGYIGKPELTKERFMDNPFGPGKIYRSGDIGRWTFDGKVQCLGRVDHQIKLRGLRIELGEIENIISSVTGVSASVVNKIELDGKEVLCAYYVANSSVSETTVKNALKKTLPQYMVPSYVIRLEEMPYTINRKIDRKSLPLPDLHKSISTEKINIAELNSDEEKLLQIWKNILKIDDIDINDNFFDIGGDSISAIQMQIEAIKYGLSFEYADIFNYPTIKELSNKLPASEIDFIKNYDYTKINHVLSQNNINNFSTIKPANINNILLVGSTGFLGAHIIDEFLKQNTGIIYCLIRPKNKIDPISRLNKTLKFYFGNTYTNDISKRIRVVTGDITQKNLGLSSKDYNLIKNNIDVIINSGAIVKHYGLKKEFEDINVLGTKNIVDFCKNENKRLLHISTMSVSGSGEKEEAIEETDANIKNKKQFYETNLFIGQKLKGIYTTTKYKAELIVLEAIYDGLDAQILRLGNITNRYRDGVFQQNVNDNAFAKRIKSFIEIGAIPKYMLKHSIELTPVDLAAESIVKILNYTSKCNVFHIYNTKLLPISLLLETLNSLEYEILPMSDNMLASLITGILADNDKKNILSGIIYDLDESKKLIYTYNVRLHADFTQQYLQHISFDWLDIDSNYIIRYMNYFKKINFIDGGIKNE